ncbi:MAG: M20/M25/M40 family metallo-hydrolase [Candidatus Dormibacteraceae bacterium]
MSNSDPAAVAELLSELVSIDSVNPTLVPGGGGEAAIAARLAELLRGAGLDVDTPEVAAGRPNAIGVLRGRDTQAPGLVLCGHLDTVGVAGMTVDPFGGRIEGDRVYGRGAFDMKAGLAAIVEAARRIAAAGGGDGDLIVALVADEEDRSLGAEQFAGWIRDRGLRPAAGIVPEPTGLSIVNAHKGFSWSQVETEGRAAHGSAYEEGVDAISLMGRVLARLEALDRDELPRHTHPILGRGSVHCGLISGGQERSSYPARCVLDLERRLIPGETAASAGQEIEGILAGLRGESSDFRATYRQGFERPPLEVPLDAPIVRALDIAVSATLGPDAVRHEGIAGWADSQILSAAGIQSVLFGPGSGDAGADLGLAHSAGEYASIESTVCCADLLVAAAHAYWGRTSSRETA